jgi:tRNA-dihydrouridine synthase B
MKQEKLNDSIAKMIDAKIILAPMSGITDVPFRLMARKFGCRFAFTEMIDVNGVFYNNHKTLKMLDRIPGDDPLGVQIVGEDPEKILYAAKVCEEKGFSVLDFNAGCPAPKVVKSGKGSALLKDPKKLAGIVKKLVRTLKIPVTVKIRSGWDESSLNYIEIAKAAEGEGASAICIHSRTKKQMYKGKACRETIRKAKKAVSIPVFASGNIFLPSDVEEVFKITGCDAAFLARGVFGKPWIFGKIYNHLADTDFQVPRIFEDVKKTIIEHFSLCLRFYDFSRTRSKMYKHICWYLKRYKGLNEVMKRYVKLQDFNAFLKFMEVI